MFLSLYHLQFCNFQEITLKVSYLYTWLLTFVLNEGCTIWTLQFNWHQHSVLCLAVAFALYVIFKDRVWRLLFQHGILLFSSGKHCVWLQLPIPIVTGILLTVCISDRLAWSSVESKSLCCLCVHAHGHAHTLFFLHPIHI